MTIREAENIVEELEYKSVLTDDEEFMLIEAFNYLIEQTKNSLWMIKLGGYYYGHKDFDLALKYYELADSYGNEWAPEGLGYIWYYGRTGEKDYKKAFYYYSKAAENGYLKSKIKVADMYKNGYYVKQDHEKYCAIIEEIYSKIKNTNLLYDPLPEVCMRLAKIREEQGDPEAAIDLYLHAKFFLWQRLRIDPFFGELNMMKWLTDDLYALTDVDYSDFDLYDLYYILKEPAKVSFLYQGDEYIVESVKEDDDISISFDGKWYRTIDDFFSKAIIDGRRITELYTEVYAFKRV